MAADGVELVVGAVEAREEGDREEQDGEVAGAAVHVANQRLGDAVAILDAQERYLPKSG